jgi:calcium/calmodulin-dependent protein kinase I
MAKACLCRGIEIVKLTNRIEAHKMQEDEQEDAPGQADVPADAKAGASSALSGEDAGKDLSTSTEAGSSAGSKKNLSNTAKGAIFKEVVLAKVKVAKEQEHALQVEKDAQDKGRRGRITGRVARGVS